jgi:ribulose-5-phosphate 4-epimerase/fuculose-1-phosphate aldolase
VLTGVVGYVHVHPNHGNPVQCSLIGGFLMAAETKPLINVDQLKFDMCCAARILFRAGLSVANAGHISVMTASDRMLMNRFGPSFGTLVPHDILTLDFRGNVIEDHTPQKNARVNETVELHGIIHRYNPELICALHTHPPATVTFSTLRKLPEVYDQESCVLAGEVAVVEEDYSGLASEEERLRSTAEAVGRHRAVILPNHGAITSGPNVQMALFAMMVLEGMVVRNLSVAAAARATGFTPTPIKMQHAMAAKLGIARMNALEPLWADQLHRLLQTDPELFV